MLLVSFPGGFLWQHWLMFAGPIWVLKMIKEREQVWIFDGQRILFVFGHARPRLFFVQSLWFCLGGPTAQQELSAILLEDRRLTASFVTWLAGECRVVSRKRNRLALGDSMKMKAGGASKSSITYFSKVNRC